jgi:hypothetical protein
MHRDYFIASVLLNVYSKHSPSTYIHSAFAIEYVIQAACDHSEFQFLGTSYIRFQLLTFKFAIVDVSYR